MTDVLVPIREMVEGTPNWVTDRGSDVRAIDRWDGREVYGPSHPLRVPSDVMLTNGVLRFWPSGFGELPYLNVEAWRSSAWRPVGCLYLARPASAVTLMGARLASVTPDRGRLVLSLKDQGNVSIWLYRRERMLRIAHGGLNTPVVWRNVGWYGTPPYEAMLSTATEAGVFGNALRINSGGVARFFWPAPVDVSAWSLALRWMPNAASASQADSGIAQIEDSLGSVSELSFVASDKTLRWTQGGTTLTSAPLSFTAGQPVFVSLAFSLTGGRTLTHKVPGAAVSQVLNAGAVHPGSTAFTKLVFGLVGGTFSFNGLGDVALGDEPLGGDTVSGGTGVNGRIDNAMIFSDRLSDTEAATLALATTSLGGIPSPEGRLAWYAPFDVAPITYGSPLTNGLAYEATTEGGTTRAPDPNGFTKGLVVLSDGMLDASGLAVEATSNAFDVAAIVATADSGDDLEDHQRQFHRQNHQRTITRKDVA